MEQPSRLNCGGQLKGQRGPIEDSRYSPPSINVTPISVSPL